MRALMAPLAPNTSDLLCHSPLSYSLAETILQPERLLVARFNAGAGARMLTGRQLRLFFWQRRIGQLPFAHLCLCALDFLDERFVVRGERDGFLPVIERLWDLVQFAV